MPANPDRIKQATEFFISKGWTPAQAAGIVGHGMAESNLDTKAVGDSGAAFGVFQWNDRRPKVLSFLRSKGLRDDDFVGQLEFAQHELETTESFAASQLRAAKTPEQAAAAFMHFERPSGYSRENPTGGHNWAGRKANALTVYNSIASGSYPAMGTGSVATSSVTPDPAATPAYTGTAATQPRQPWTDVEQNQQVAQRAATANPYGFGEAVNQAAEKESVLYWLGQGNKAMPDPNWTPTRDDLKRLQDGIPEHLHTRFGDAHSAAHAEQLRQNMLSDMEYERRMEAGGWRTSGVARTIGALSDPVGLGLMVLAPEVGLPAKAGLLARMGVRAAEGAAINVAVDTPRYLNKPLAEGSDLLWAAGTGMALGGLVGAVARNPAVREEADALVALGKRVQSQAETELGILPRPAATADTAFTVSPSGGSAGAMANSQRETLSVAADDWLHGAIDDAIERSWGSKVRWDIAGKGKASDNAATRAFIGSTVVDVVGNAEHKVVSKAAEEWQKQIDFDFTHAAFKTHQETFTDYAARNAERGLSKHELDIEFRSAVTRYLDDRQLLGDHDPAVRKAGDVQRKLYADFLEYMREPGRLDGTVRRAVGGAENIEKDPHYRPNLADHEKIDALSIRYGDDVMRQGIAQIFRLRAPELSEALAAKMAKGYWRRLREAGAGMNDLDHALRGHDLEKLKDTLAGLDLDEKEIQSILGIVTPKPQEGAANARLKRRALYQNDSEVTLVGRDGQAAPFRMSDLFQDDYLSNFKAYSRSMSGQIAMAMVQVKNPLWHELADESTPRYLIDGISNKGDFEKLVRDMRAVWDAKTDLPREVRKARGDADEARMRFVYERITGVPEAFDSTKLGQFIRKVKDFNFIRVMNQVGFAQVGEMMGITTQFGLKAAVEGMPAFKAMLRDAKTGELKDAFAREIEELSGAGADFFRDGFKIHLDDAAGQVLNRSAQSQTSRRIEDALHTGKRITSVISGMSTVDAFSRRWASAAAVQKFVNAAAKGGEAGLRTLATKRMRALGLDDAMTKRIMDQIRKHATWADGEVESRKYRSGNFTKWDDQEALSHFRDAIWRWSRLAIQEPHLGQTSVMLSSPMGRLITQFRTFMLGAWTNQFLRNLHMNDWHGYATWMMTSVVGGMVYAAQSHLNAIGRSDRDKYLEDRLSTKKMAAAMVQRGDWSSIMPMVFDTGADIAGFKPVFDTRASNTASSIFGSPTMDLLTGSVDAVHGIARAAREGKLSQGEVRKIQRVLPFGNAMAPIPLLNTMISGMPERAPIKPRD